MDIHEVWSIAGAILASLGGAGVIVSAIAVFVSNRVAKRLDEKYAQRLNKELEKYKINLEQKRYVTKTQFDREFEIYHQLSNMFFSMIVKLSSFTQHGIDSEKEEKNNTGISLHEMKKLIEQTGAAQDYLYSNAAFIPKDLFELYKSIMEKASELFWRYYDRFTEYKFGKRQYSEIVLDEDRVAEEAIEREFDNITIKLRDYLTSLSIVE